MNSKSNDTIDDYLNIINKYCVLRLVRNTETLISKKAIYTMQLHKYLLWDIFVAEYKKINNAFNNSLTYTFNG